MAEKRVSQPENPRPLRDPAQGTPAGTAPPDISTSEIYERYRRLVARAVEVFGDEFVANRWLTTPQEGLGNRSPLEVAQSKQFLSPELEQILGRLEHGIFP
jgi:putative toxin-antitoxin system antitoxin component (TIGR02293 family)